MNKTEKMAKIEFRRLPKSEQKRINALRRVPVAKPGHVIENSRGGKQRDNGECREYCGIRIHM